MLLKLIQSKVLMCGQKSNGMYVGYTGLRLDFVVVKLKALAYAEGAAVDVASASGVPSAPSRRSRHWVKAEPISVATV